MSDRVEARMGAEVQPPPPLVVVPDPPRRNWRRIGAAAAALLLALAGTGAWLHARNYETTDDAQVDGDIASISSRVAGSVKAVAVVDNQRVAAGDVLVQLDPADLEVAVAEARAAVAQEEAALRAEDPTVAITETSNQAALAAAAGELAGAEASANEGRASVAELEARVAQAEAGDRTAQLDRRRDEALGGQKAISSSQVDRSVDVAAASAAGVEALRHAREAAGDRIATLDARVAAARSRLAEIRANGPRQLEARRAAVGGRGASLDRARARLAQAELDLSYATIRAPAAGIVGKKTVTVGDRVAPGQQLMAVAQVDELWGTANFRETQLGLMRQGQEVDLDVDALGASLKGRVDSIGGATGSRFSVLPPENASGNYVKVVQRIPVRIVFEGGQPELARLRPGMSVDARVRVR